MKKTLVAGFAGLLAAVAFAGKDNVVVNFYTTGPDTYADGSTVVDGEYYALVFTPAGSEFAGINADGSAVAPSKVALKAPLAKNGKCPYVTFQLTEEEAQAFGNGSWAVYLLDTRRFAPAADGSLAATGATGDTTHGYTLAATAGSFASVSASSALAADGLPADRSDVKIKDIKLLDGKVYITVSGTTSAATYGLNAGDAPNATAATDVTKPGDTTDDIIFVRPAKAGGEFFSVNRK